MTVWLLLWAVTAAGKTRRRLHAPHCYKKAEKVRESVEVIFGGEVSLNAVWW